MEENIEKIIKKYKIDEIVDRCINEELIQRNVLSRVYHGEPINVGRLINLDDQASFLKYADEMWDILTISYADKGGLKSYKSYKDFINRSKTHTAKIILNDEGEMLACQLYRLCDLNSHKIVCGGCIHDEDGIGKLALQQLIQYDIEHLELNVWAEVSGSIE